MVVAYPPFQLGETRPLVDHARKPSAGMGRGGFRNLVFQNRIPKLIRNVRRCFLIAPARLRDFLLGMANIAPPRAKK